jgi:hypothetical protein
LIWFVTSKCLPYFPPAERYARLHLPFSGSLWPRFPTFPVKALYALDPRYYDPLRLPTALLGLLRSSLVPRYLACSLYFVSPPEAGSLRGGSNLISARALGQLVPLIFRPCVTRRQQALPSSRVAPVSACPALRPRWCPEDIAPLVPRTAAFRAKQTVGFPPVATQRGYPGDHNSFLHFGAQSRGLPPRSIRLRTPHCWQCTRTSLLTRWLCFGQMGLDPNPDLTHWATTANFMSFHPIPTPRA